MEMLAAFTAAEEYVRENHPEEVEWSLRMIEKIPSDTKKQDFLEEYAWTVYTSGFKVDIMRKKWPDLKKAWMNFDPGRVSERFWQVTDRARAIINNKSKIDRILRGVDIVHILTPFQWWEFLKRVERDVDELTLLPGIAEVTKYHLARNIGVDTIKPDVHMVRMAEHYELDPFEMCEKISEAKQLPVHLVDTVIWRASADGFLNFRDDIKCPMCGWHGKLEEAKPLPADSGPRCPTCGQLLGKSSYYISKKGD